MKHYPKIFGVIMVALVVAAIFTSGEVRSVILVFVLISFIAFVFFSTAVIMHRCSNDYQKQDYERALRAMHTCKCGNPKEPDMLECPFCNDKTRKKFKREREANQWDKKKEYEQKHHQV